MHDMIVDYYRVFHDATVFCAILILVYRIIQVVHNLYFVKSLTILHSRKFSIQLLDYVSLRYER